MSDIADAVQPVNSVAEEDCWKRRRMFNAYKRLNMAYKLNQWDQTDEVTNLAEDTKTAASPSQKQRRPPGRLQVTTSPRQTRQPN